MTDSPQVQLRLTVGFIRDAAAALARVCERKAINKADAINKAIQVYDMISLETETLGKKLVLLDERDGSTETIRLL